MRQSYMIKILASDNYRIVPMEETNGGRGSMGEPASEEDRGGLSVNQK
jgi:hypothetical protein